ncbi:hypothetical protein TKK_0004624 [Trichogramma kaykai]
MLFIILNLALLLFLSPARAALETKCPVDYAKIIEFEQRFHFRIHGLDVKLHYDDHDLADTTVTAGNETQISIPTANVAFTAFVSRENGLSTEKIQDNFKTGRFIVKGPSKSINGSDECKLVKEETYSLGRNIPYDIGPIVRHFVRECEVKKVCAELQSLNYNGNPCIRPTDEISFKDHQQHLLEICPTSMIEDIKKNPQETVNALIDFVMSKGINSVTKNSSGIVDIPRVHQPFATGRSFWEVQGAFDIFNGTVRDLRTLERVGDIVFSNNRQRFEVSLLYKLSDLLVEIDHYNIRYGKININGNVTMAVSDLELLADLSVDYNEKPCRATLNQLVERKPYKVEFQLTGLWILNRPVSSIIKWLIPKYAIPQAQKALANLVANFDCERYRPKIQL